MPILDLNRWNEYRRKSFHIDAKNRVTNPSKALDFINQCGFAFFWPVKGVDLPSLWVAVAGDRPVPDEHDDPGHVTWDWKDDGLDKRIWYYGKILRRKATFISLEFAPHFYALSDNYGSPEEDYLAAYQAGRLTQAAKQIYEALLDNGPLDTISLRKEAHLQNAKESVFTRGLEDLQRDFKILPVGIAQAGAWRYAYRYDITSRHYPDLPERARAIGEADARQFLSERYLRLVGAALQRDVIKLFGWSPEVTNRALGKLIGSGDLMEKISHPKMKGDWLAVPELVAV